LLQARVEGIAAIAKRPPAGWRDTVALVFTGFGVFVMGGIGAWLTREPAGVLLGPAYGAFGYRKQFWQAVLQRKPRLDPVPKLAATPGEPLVGTAQIFDKELVVGELRGVLVATTEVQSRRGVLLRVVDAVAFWLVMEDRKVLVTGTCWIQLTDDEPRQPLAPNRYHLGIYPQMLARADRQSLVAARTTISRGDVVAVTGTVRREQLAGMDGYRDSFADVIRGGPGDVVWIEKRAAGATRTP
jgi:hypothetical protein